MSAIFARQRFYAKQFQGNDIMTRHIQRGVTVVLFTLLMPSLANAVVVDTSSYYVRPGLRVDLGEFIDGYQPNGDTVSTMTQGVLGYSETTVNLNDGTVKMYMEHFGDTEGNLQTFGGFGERITITGGAGTYWDFSFAVDGFLETYGGNPIINGIQEPAFFYDAGLAIYNAGQVNYNNFVPGFNDFSALFYEQDATLEQIDGSEEFSFYDIFAGVSGSILLESDYEVFDIFTFTNMIVNTKAGDGLDGYLADLLNTATYSQTLAQGVNAFSSSGQFLGLTTPPVVNPPTPVPIPPMWGVLLLAMVGMARGAQSRQLRGELNPV